MKKAVAKTLTWEMWLAEATQTDAAIGKARRALLDEIAAVDALAARSPHEPSCRSLWRTSDVLRRAMVALDPERAFWRKEIETAAEAAEQQKTPNKNEA